MTETSECEYLRGIGHALCLFSSLLQKIHNMLIGPYPYTKDFPGGTHSWDFIVIFLSTLMRVVFSAGRG